MLDGPRPARLEGLSPSAAAALRSAHERAEQAEVEQMELLLRACDRAFQARVLDARSRAHVP
jgi:hypothetical protein